MQLNYEHGSDGSPDQVAVLFRNEAFIDDVARHANVIGHTVNITDDATHLDLTLPASESIPKFLGKGIRVRQPFIREESDDMGVRKGIFTVNVAGIPVNVEVDTALSPTDPSSSEVVHVGELSVKIPLVGKKAEVQVELMIARAFVGTERRTQNWLSRV